MRELFCYDASMSDTVQQIKDRLSIVDVVSGYVKLERAGQNMRARCPFHSERTPSFIVSPDRGTYHCFGCSVGGDVFSFVQAIEGVDFKGALKILAERAGVEFVYARGEKEDDKDRLFAAMEAATVFYQSKMNTEAEGYLVKRGLEKQTIATFRIGYAGDGWTDLSDHLRGKKFSEKEIVDAGLAKKGDRGLSDKFRNRVMFPIADNAGRVVAFSGRTFGEKAHPDAPKYLNSPETALYHKSRILYGFDRAKQSIRRLDFSLLVEGQLDLILSHQAGWGNTVAVSGTAFTVEHAALLKRMSENLCIALDADEAGLKAAARAARAALQQGMNVKIVELPKDVDPADLISKDGADAWKARIREAKDVIAFLLDALEARAKAPDAFRRVVETAIIPFLLDVQSPIAREQYERLIAKRLGVSEAAIAEARTKLARVTPSTTPVSDQKPEKKMHERAAQAFGILLWQESLSKPTIDFKEFAQDFEEVIGSELFKALRAKPPAELEALRFHAEALHGGRESLTRDVALVMRMLRRERLDRELAENAEALRKAEAGGGAGAQELLERGKLLTAQIAKIAKEE